MAKKGLNEYLNGYIIVKVECLNPEKFINMASRHGIKLWDIERINFTTINFKMKHSQYRMLKKIVLKTNSKIKILKKYGFHFTYTKMARRKFFIFGTVVFIAVILYLSSIIWNIEISGNKKVETSRIYSCLKKAGLKEGIFKYNLNLRQIESDVIKQLDQVSIVKISFQGTKADVQIVERTMPPVILNTDKPTNVIASKEGIITKILSYKGQSVVKRGDFVKPKQILISGILTDATNVPGKIVHAMGEVKAKTWYEASKEVNLNYKYEVRSGRFKQKIYYIILGRKICVKNSNINFNKYDKIEEKNRVRISNRNMPFERITEYYYEKIDQYKKLDYNEALSIAAKEAEEKVKSMVPSNSKILDKKYEKKVGNGKAKIRILYICEENIGIESEIK